MSRKKTSIAEWMADSRTRAWVHACILLLLAGILLGSFARWDLGGTPPRRPDALDHYRAGQAIAAIVFYLAYIGILARVLRAGHRRRHSLTGTLLWVPSSMAAALLAAIVVSLLLTLGKETWDWGSYRAAEGVDFEAGLAGALSILPGVALMMAITPLFIPLDILMQIPKLMLGDVRTGIRSVDAYARENKFHRRLPTKPTVLVVEDDIACAAATMRFFRNLGWKCRHVYTIEDADEYLHRQRERLRVIALDIFVRVGRRGDNSTGEKWLRRIAGEFPRNGRNFSIVVISGHTDLLGEAASLADLILQKPWDPRELLAYLRQAFPREFKETAS